MKNARRIPLPQVALWGDAGSSAAEVGVIQRARADVGQLVEFRQDWCDTAHP